jgi:hypothetical protein
MAVLSTFIYQAQTKLKKTQNKQHKIDIYLKKSYKTLTKIN